MISETRTMNGHSFATQYGYDSVSGDLASMTYPGGMVLTYQRNSNGEITGIYADGQAVVSGVSYLPFGPANNRTLGNGMTISETFDDRYQLSRIQAGTVADYQYVRDDAGNITSSTGFQIPTIPASAAGNIQYDYVANHLVSMSGRSYVYDSDGNILSDGIRTFVYNQDNRLIRVSIGGNVVGEYAYDAFGRRVKKIASGVTTLYHYAGGNLIAETDENGVTLRDYVYLNGEPAAVRIYGSQDGMYYFLNDHLGTPQKIVSSSGQVVWAAAYFPFGKAQVKPEIITNNLRFPGQYFDSESGLHYNWNRYYDPERGRYITADPIGLSGGINLYSYVMNNPMIWSDPSGLDTLRTRVLALVAEGEFAEAIFIAESGGLKLADELRALQNTLSSLINKYPPSAFKCDKLATKVYDAFKAIKEINPIGLRITPKGVAQGLIDGSEKLFGIGQHYAVRVGDMVYDALTGPMGMKYAEYEAMLAKWGNNVAITEVPRNAIR